MSQKCVSSSVFLNMSAVFMCICVCVYSGKVSSVLCSVLSFLFSLCGVYLCFTTSCAFDTCVCVCFVFK